MIINAYQITCDNRIMDKTQYLGTATVLQGETRDQSVDLINPSILVSSDCPIDCNYAEIPAFRRFYYVTIDVIRSGLYLMQMHCDVLMSFRTDIKAAKCVAVRTREAGETDNINLYVPDRDLPSFAYTEDTVHIIGSFSAGWTGGAYVCTVG